MNGFIRHGSKGLLWLASMAAMGCHTLDVACPTGSCGVAANDCNSGAIQPCGGCSRRSCSHCWGSLGDKLRQFDWEQVHPDHCWPTQYSRISKNRVNGPLRQQMINGNVLELTLWDHYFEKDEDRTHELNTAGQARLQYLARKKPYVIHNLQLQTSFNADLDQQRIDAVKEYSAQFAFEPELTVVNRVPSGLFGEEAPKAITKMIGPGGGPPVYEPRIKQDF